MITTKSMRGHVHRFADALRTAIYDRELELEDARAGDAGIVFFYDADVVIRVIQGFRQYDQNEDYRLDANDPDVRLRALLSSGYLGRGKLLKPHALELDEQVRNEPKYKVKTARKLYGGRVEAFLEAQGVDQILERLKEVVAQPGTEQEQVERFLEELRAIGGAPFVAIELATGAWQQRLRRVWGRVLSLDTSSNVQRVMGSKEMHDFADALNSGRPDRSLNNLRDAAALATLASCVLDRTDGRRVPYVRFYSETRALERVVLESPELTALLTYPERPNEADHQQERFVFRSPDYFILRATFEALSMPGVSPDAEDTELVVTLDELSRVSRELDELVSRDEFGLESREAARLRIGGRPLSQVLREFSDVSFMETLWVRRGVPDAMKKLLRDLPDVWAFAQEGSSSEHLRNSIHRELSQIEETLTEGLSDLEQWLEQYKKIRDGQEQVRKRLRGHRVPDVKRDLGLVRWGAEPPDTVKTRLAMSSQQLLSSQAEERRRAASALASALAEVTSDEDCLVVCAQLWLLNLWSDVVNTIDRYRRSKGAELPPSLELMRAAALLRQRRIRSLDELEQIVARLRKLANRLEGEARGGFYLGLGYVTFYAWDFAHTRAQEAEAADKKSERYRKAASRWAKESFKAGMRSEFLLPMDSLAWGFAINHCAYVGTVTEVDPEHTRTFITRLAGLEARPDIWHYRFVDTLAWHNYLRAQRVWERAKRRGGELDQEKRDLVFDLLQEAEELLNSAREDLGDPEITQHLGEIRRLRNAVRADELLR